MFKRHALCGVRMFAFFGAAFALPDMSLANHELPPVTVEPPPQQQTGKKETARRKASSP